MGTSSAQDSTAAVLDQTRRAPGFWLRGPDRPSRLPNSAVLLSFCLIAAISTLHDGLAWPIGYLFLASPLLLGSLALLLHGARDSKSTASTIGPGVSAVGLAASVLFFFVLPLPSPRADLAALAAGISALLLPSLQLARLSAAAVLGFIPVHFLEQYQSLWMWGSTGLLIAASSKVASDWVQCNRAGKLELTRQGLSVNKETSVGSRPKPNLDTLVRRNRDGIVELDSHQNITSLNPGFEKVTGWLSSDWIHQPFDSLLHETDREKFSQALCLARKNQESSLLEVRILSRKGDTLPLELAIVHHPATDGLYRRGDITLIMRRVAGNRRNIEGALPPARTNDGMWDWDLTRSSIYLSSRWKKVLGYDDSEIGNHPAEWFNRVHPEDLRNLRAALVRHMSGQSPRFEATFRLIHKSGDYRWVACRGLAERDRAGQVKRIVGSQTDITSFKLKEEQFHHDAFQDPMTGLANRALFMDRLDRSIKRSRRTADYSFAVLFLDLDRFKVVNDSLGHEAGDQLLATAASRLRGCIRPGDMVARLGGDEFTILLENVSDVEDADRVAQRVHRQLRAPFDLAGQEVFVTASIGIALSKSGYDRPADLLRDADLAMYRAKILGKARHQVFDGELHTHAAALLQLEADLRHAVERNEFMAHYQPIICLESGTVHGFEALVRWNHPDRGLLGPADFLNQAEETGLIVPVGWWILRESCRQMKQWQESFQTVDFPLTISVNLSPRQLSQPDILMQIESALEDSHLDPKALRLEITESAVLEASAIEPLKRVKELGVELHLDDFGTGYSSLRYLDRLLLDAIKIDRSFIAALNRGAESSRIVEAMVALSHTLGLKVIAEGVETTEQAKKLRAIDCEFGQGFLFSAPLDNHAAERLMQSLLAARLSPAPKSAHNVRPFVSRDLLHSRASS